MGSTQRTPPSRQDRMTNLSQQKRLAAAVAGVGKRRVFLDPLHLSVIANANSRKGIKKLISDNIVVVKPEVVHTRARVRGRVPPRHACRQRSSGCEDRESSDASCASTASRERSTTTSTTTFT